MTTAAQEEIRLRSCRPTMATQTVSRHAARRAFHFCTTTTGQHRQLVVMADFSNLPFTDIYPLPLWNRVFNEEGLSEEPFHGSVRDYFLTQSYGQFDITFDLQHITLADEYRKYRSTDQDDENSKYLVADIADSLQARGIDWSPYDWDGDGTIDQLLIVYAGKGMNDGGGRNTIWPHQWWLSEHEDCAPKPVESGGNTYYVDAYCCVQELTGENTYGTFGTICHEYSHCFGLPDLYYGSSTYIKNWDIMDYGNYNQDGFCPPCYSAHERMLLGWLQPKELTENTIVSGMADTGQHAEAYLIRNDGHPDEFYIIENRQPVGWDQSLPASGIVVFHIDYDKETWEESFPNTDSKKCYTIIPANNNSLTIYQHLWAYPQNGNDQLTNDSKPAATLLNANTDGTKFISKPITDMQVTDGLASFTFTNASASSIHTLTGDQPHHCYDLQGRDMGSDRDLLPQGIYIIRFADGTTQKVFRR